MTGPLHTTLDFSTRAQTRIAVLRIASFLTLPCFSFYLGASSAAAFSQSVTEESTTSEFKPDSTTKKYERGSNDRLDRLIVRQGTTSTTKLSFWKPLKLTLMDGHVVDLSTSGAILQLEELGSDGKPRQVRIPSDQLLEIRPVWQEPGISELIDLFKRGQYAEFIQGLRDYDRNSIPRWKQLLLLEMVFQAVNVVQGPEFSGQHFIKLAEAGPSFVYAEIPCCWTAQEPSLALIRKSQEWLESTSEVAQLIGGSWLLFGANSAKAKQALEKLRDSSNEVLAQLAAAQLWRLESPPRTMEKLPEWLAYRDRMLPSVALGPTEFLADRLERIGETDLAVGQWLWIATCSPDRHNKSVQALRSAESLLRNVGKNLDAEKIAEWRKELDGNSE